MEGFWIGVKINFKMTLNLVNGPSILNVFWNQQKFETALDKESFFMDSFILYGSKSN